MTAKVLAIGHSHLGAMVEAYEASQAGGHLPYRLTPLQLLRHDRPIVVHTGGVPRYPEDVEREVLDQLAAVAPDLVVLMLEGQQAATMGFARPSQPWDFLLPNETGAPSIDGDMLPFDLASDIARRHFAHVARFLDQIRAALGSRVVALSPPPPVGDDAVLMARIDRSPNLRDAVLATGLAPRAWRRRVWIIMVTALAEAYMTRGVTFLPPPPQAMDAEGFLRLPMLSDALHGNPRYGELLLEQLAQWSGSA